MLQLIGRGRTHDETAAELVLSPATARTYVSRMLSNSAPGTAVRAVLAYRPPRVVPGDQPTRGARVGGSD